LLKTQGYDAVICHGNWPYAVFAPVVRTSRAALVLWSHDCISEKSRWNSALRSVKPDLVLANSRFTANGVRGVLPDVPIEVVYHPLDSQAVERSSARRSVRPELGTPDDDVVILCASRLERWKGHAELVQALGRLRGKPGWRCWLAGGPQRSLETKYLSELKRLAADLRITDRVQFLGQRSDVPQLMAASDVFCQPNVEGEPFGVVFVEALQAGIPVVTSAIGGALEIVTDGCGKLTPPRDVAALAEALAELIDSPAARMELGAAGPERASALCDPRRQLSRLNDLLASASAGQA
jgi:glycosyltransferase involved in cell wall biosynthesis